MLLIPLKLRWGTVTYDFDNEITGKCLDGTEFRIKASAAQIDRWLNGDEFIQDVFPELSDNQREILITGLSPPHFDNLFKEEEE